MPQYGDDLYLGQVPIPNPGLAYLTALGMAGGGGPSLMDRGIGPMGRVLIYDILPAALATNNVVAAQIITGASNAIINGALATAGVATMDYARTLQMVSANAGDTTQTVTITGTDFWGRVVSQIKTLNGTTPVNFTKAFKTVTRVAVSATTAGNLTIGTRDVFALPVLVSNAAYFVWAGWNNTLARDAGTFTAGDATTPATTATTDAAGLYAPSSAADGVKRLVLAIALRADQAGPTATALTLYGVTPV